MSEVLVRFAHISDTHIQPVEGALERRRQTLEQIQSSASQMEPYILDGVLEHVGEKLDDDFPFTSAVEACETAISALNAHAAMHNEALDFVFHTGDVVDHGEPAEYELAREIFNQLNMPIHYAIGNHDKIGSFRAGLFDDDGNETPYDHTFDVNGVQFISVDSATHVEGRIGWHVAQEQLDWLHEQIRDDDRPLVIGIHHPPYPIGVRWLDSFILQNWEAVHNVIKEAGPRLRGVFSGHVHVPVETVRDGVFYSIVPEVYSYISGYTVVTVLDDGIRTHRHSLV